jgi:hypothetical protein
LRVSEDKLIEMWERTAGVEWRQGNFQQCHPIPTALLDSTLPLNQLLLNAEYWNLPTIGFCYN